MTKVAVVDDHGVVLAGLKFVLSRAEGMEVVATAESAEDILGFYEKAKPDVLLLDIRMPSVSGLDALETLRKSHPDAKVAMLTTSELEEDIFRALKLGANGYIPKDSRPAEIAKAVREIASGGRYIPEDIQRIFDMRQGVKSLSARELSRAPRWPRCSGSASIPSRRTSATYSRRWTSATARKRSLSPSRAASLKARRSPSPAR